MKTEQWFIVKLTTGDNTRTYKRYAYPEFAESANWPERTLGRVLEDACSKWEPELGEALEIEPLTVYLPDSGRYETRTCCDFGDLYAFVQSDYELDHFFEMYRGYVEGSCGRITGAMALIGDGELDELWVTNHSRPYDCSTTYTKVFPLE